jgi:uncharacterized peroxidase-related enzyme
MTDPNSTLFRGYEGSEPYSWLRGDDSVVVPPEALDELPVAERHSTEAMASFEPEGSARLGAWMVPLFFDPDYGLLSPAEREFIAVIVSATNSCPTCMLIHVHRLGEFIGNHGRARRIAINYRAVDLSIQERAIADYCIKFTASPGHMEAADMQLLRDAGLDDRKIYYVIELAAAFNLSNRMTAGFGYRPDDEWLLEISPPSAD